MTVLPNIWAKLFFWAYMALFVVGLATFLKNIVRKDWDYETRFPCSLLVRDPTLRRKKALAQDKPGIGGRRR